ncbi:6-carboxytetrahydropterin synthase [Domibacillus iocasae]|uniref:6-carboxy-5,6,7,8-tetrahydropterin synthase n=1 Tax=Domibacillus iocasae TaxID=1714016 RepID=A0A1E7DTD3_9BACI|nr:6-carboxytetrahydropterin synthase [Domibacillus iocasae]OES46321.1 6-pyruvoyl tetrahydropterin synthase [Domibacillus iocasae]
MVLLTRKVEFSSAHSYHVPTWSAEKNKEIFGLCNNPNGHGHDYTLEVTVKGKINSKSGIVVNITDIDRIVKDLVLEELDGKFLNREHPFFKEHIPTTENIVAYIWNELNDKFDDCKLHKIKLHENPFLLSEKGEKSMIQLTRKYHFSAAHRLHSDQLSDEENKMIFGKCNNPHGHGHNYILEVTVDGEADPVTGMVINLADLDRAVDETIIQKFDHKHLNLDTEEFSGLNPTAEVMTVVFWELLQSSLPNLSKIGLWETAKNYFEYSGPEMVEAYK